jgi:hypothetical protein
VIIDALFMLEVAKIGFTIPFATRVYLYNNSLTLKSAARAPLTYSGL